MQGGRDHRPGARPEPAAVLERPNICRTCPVTHSPQTPYKNTISSKVNLQRWET